MAGKGEGGVEDNKYGDGVSWIRGSMIGKGGFGCVYLATLRKNPKSKYSYFPPVMAVKSAEVSSSASIQKEREVLSNLRGSPYVIRCFGEETTMGENGAMVYNLLLEYGAGGTLADRIRKLGGVGLPESEVRLFARSILRGLNYVHCVGYVHCDLKPENVFLVKGNGGGKSEVRAKIGDFGLAKRVIKQGKKRKLEPYWRGTPMYLSPEAVMDNVQEPPCDVWALGCIVLEMLTGRPAWGVEKEFSVDEILFRIGAGRELPKVPDGVSKEARDFLKRCFVRNAMFRLTAEMLLSHPFVEGLEEDEGVEEGAEVEDLNEVESILLISESDDDDEYSSDTEEEDSCCFLSEEDEFDEEDENASSISEDVFKGEDVDARVGQPNEKKSRQVASHVPSQSRQHYPVNYIVPARV